MDIRHTVTYNDKEYMLDDEWYGRWLQIEGAYLEYRGRVYRQHNEGLIDNKALAQQVLNARHDYVTNKQRLIEDMVEAKIESAKQSSKVD